MAAINAYDAVLTAGASSVTVTSLQGSPTAYTVYDITGTVVASGSVSGSSVTISGWSAGTIPAGWYLIAFTSAAWSGASGYWVDSIQINVFRSGVASLASVPSAGTSPSASDLNNKGYDDYMHGFTGMGPQRWQIHDAANPTTFTAGEENGATTAGIAANVALDNGAAGYTDAARPRPEFVAFPNNLSSESGYAAGVESVVTAIGPGTSYNVIYFEGLNEPQGSNGLTAAQSAAQYNAFRAAVKAANSNAMALGPAEVKYSPSGSAFGTPDSTDLATFLADITAGTLDGFSVHDYNAYNGDFIVTDAWLSLIRTALSTAGYSASLPLFFTETGNISFQFGEFCMRRYVQWTMQLLHTGERWGLPKEHISWFYDYANPGFAYQGGNSWIKEQTGDLRALATAIRVWSEELYGKTYSSALNFGTVGNNYYRGNVFTGTAGTTVALLAQGNPGDTCTLNVSDTGSITYVDWRGATNTTTVTGGQITVPISDLPTYVRLSASCTVSVADVGNGLAGSLTNLAPSATASSATGSSFVSVVNDGVMQTGGYVPNSPTDNQYAGSPLPDSVTLTWSTAQTFNKIVIRQVPPWTNWYAAAMTQGKLEYWNGSGWLPCPTVAARHWNSTGVYSNPTAMCQLGVIGGIDYMVTFYDQNWNHNVDLQIPITTTKLRWTVTASGIGQLPNSDAAAYYPTNDPQQLMCSELQVFQIGAAPATQTYLPHL